MAAKKTFSPTKTLGTGGSTTYGGYVFSGETNPLLAPTTKYKTYSNILANVDIVAAGVRYFTNLVGKAAWRVEPADDTPQAHEIAETVEAILYDMRTPWNKVVRRAAMYKFYGFSTQEWTAKKRDDGAIGFLDVSARPQITVERWELDEFGVVEGMYQRNPTTQQVIYIPRGKMLYMNDDVLNDSPEGLGLFRHITESANLLSYYEQLEGFGYETDLRGVPIGRAPLGVLQTLVKEGKISNADSESFLTTMKLFLQNHVRNKSTSILLDSAVYQTQNEAGTPSSQKLWDVELIKGQSNSLDDISKAIERITRNIAIVLGVENMLLGTNSGSLALSKDKSGNFYLTIDSALTDIAETAEIDLLRPLARMNGWPIELMPTLKTEPIKIKDVQEITAALRDLAQAGSPMQMQDPAVEEIRDLLGVSAPIYLDTEDTVAAPIAPEETEDEQMENEPPESEPVDEVKE